MSERTIHHLQASDGTALVVEEGGNPQGRPVVLLHGIAQSRRSFAALLGAPSSTYRWLALDMRGHGESGKPEPAEAYADGRRLGDDLAEVLAALALQRPLVVAWSYGGAVLGEYLRQRGDAALGGVLLLASAWRLGKAGAGMFGATMMDHARDLLSDDPALYAEAARAFLRGCSASEVDPAVLETELAAMLAVPVYARRALLKRSVDFGDELAACQVPVVALHGLADSVVLPVSSDALGALRADVQQRRVADAGHCVWREAPAAFLEALDALDAAAGDAH